jgi:hypothetical protein
VLGLLAPETITSIRVRATLAALQGKVLGQYRRVVDVEQQASRLVTAWKVLRAEGLGVGVKGIRQRKHKHKRSPAAACIRISELKRLAQRTCRLYYEVLWSRGYWPFGAKYTYSPYVQHAPSWASLCGVKPKQLIGWT